MDNDMLPYLASGLGMVLVAIIAVTFWWRVSHIQFRWFWVGAGLWAVAVILKVISGLLTNAPVIGFLKQNVSYPLLVAGGGLFIGVESSAFEMGCTLGAGLIWRQLGSSARRAIAIGVGAGSFEALLLGVASLVTVAAVLAGIPGTEKIREGLKAAASAGQLLWLAAPIERVMAILCHASTRALVLLGIANRKRILIFWGFLIFTLLDGVAGAAHVSGRIGTFSMWWIELALLPFALVSVAILRWCYIRWGKQEDQEKESRENA